MNECVCGHAPESHGGHTHLAGTPEPAFCACCPCPAYRKDNRPRCLVCRKPIGGVPYFQGDSRDHPVHKDCRLVIGRSRDGGG